VYTKDETATTWEQEKSFKPSGSGDINTKDNTPNTQSSQSKNFPKTGEESSAWLIGTGSIIVALTAGLLFTKRKKKI